MPIEVTKTEGELVEVRSYQYDPKEDITAYELALIVRVLDAASARTLQNLENEPNWEKIKRHFKQI